jgi:hypothetical protein
VNEIYVSKHHHHHHASNAQDYKQFIIIITIVIEKGKANRSVLQQANLEAQSKWNEKTQRDTYAEVIYDNSKVETTLIVRPMLAESFKKELYTSTSTSRAFKLTFPVCIQRKFDGIRCICHQSIGNVICIYKCTYFVS